MITRPAVLSLLFYPCFNKRFKMIAIDSSKEHVLDADPKAIQQINFNWNLEQAGNTVMFFMVKEAKETISDFSQVLWIYFPLI